MTQKKQLRIIGGHFRSRMITFDPSEGIRPTPNRVRETLFNWLMPVMPGARCLDLFAGSGALSIEAVSRGAGFVVMNDQSPKILRQLQQTLHQLNIPSDKILLSNLAIRNEPPHCRGISKIPPGHFDIVFIDPPFGKDLIVPSCAMLLEQNWIDANSLVYIESEKAFNLEDRLTQFEQKFKIMKKGETSQTAYFLLQLDNNA